MHQLIKDYYSRMDALGGDYSQMEDCFNDDMLFHFPGIPHPMTVTEFQHPAQAIYHGFSDFRHSVEEIIGDGDKLACRLNITGTHNGEFQGLPPSQKSIAISAITIFRIVNGKISEHWISVDLLGMMKQIGAVA